MRTNWFKSYKRTANARRETNKQKDTDMSRNHEWWNDEIKRLENDIDATNRDNKRLMQHIETMEGEQVLLIERISRLNLLAIM